MKTNRSLLILAGGLAVLIVGIFLMWWFFPSTNSPASPDSGNSTVVNNQPTPASATSALLADQPTNATTKTEEVGGFFKTVIDQQSGQYAIVNSNKTAVTLRDKNGKMIWSSNIMETISPKAKKYMGSEITDVKLINGELIVFVQMSGYFVDKKTGKASYVGSD